MTMTSDHRVTIRLLEFGRSLALLRGRTEVAEAVAAVVHELGAEQVIVALSAGNDGPVQILASRGFNDVASGSLPVDVVDAAAHIDGGEWTVVPLTDGGSLRARDRPAGGLLSEEILGGLAEMAAIAIVGYEQVSRDCVTGLLTRRGFDDGLACAVRDHPGVRWSVVSGNLNNFRWVNEILGVQYGDGLLKVVAARFVEAAPSAAFIARVNADHFLIAVPRVPDDPSPTELVARLDRILRQPVDLGGETICPSATFGLAGGAGTSGDPAEAAESFVTLADSDLRRNRDRRDGRLFTAGSIDSLRLDTEMHAAVAANSIHAHFQPIYELRTGTLSGFEALARWTTPDGRSVAPSDFIPLAEDNGLIHALGDQMLWEAQRLLANHLDDSTLTVHVNVSTVQLTIPGFSALFARRFSDNPDALRRIIVEVTESRQIVDHHVVSKELDALRRQGAGVALDDFGSGYSTFARLQRLPATQIKIDRSFIQDAVVDGTGILVAMIGAARAFGLEVVAEGIETEEQLHMVQELGCDRVQGFLFGRAVAPEALAGVSPTILPMLKAA